MSPRARNAELQEPFLLAFDHALASATEATKLLTARRSMRVDAVEYNNPTGFAADPNDYWTIALKKGSTVIAQWSTKTGENGALAADTPVDLANSATDANLVAHADDVLSLSLTKSGSAADLPAGRIVVHGRYV